MQTTLYVQCKNQVAPVGLEVVRAGGNGAQALASRAAGE